MNNKLGIKYVSISLIALLIIGSLPLIFEFNDEQATANAAIITVDDDGQAMYTTIQAAIDNATAGDTIKVWAGTYFENVLVNKTVTLIGNGTTNTTIDGGGVGDVVYITEDWVNVSDFQINNSGTNWGDAGIEIYDSTNSKIEDNNCSNNGYGIYLYFSSSNTLVNNNCSNTNIGFDLDNSPNNTLVNNTCNSNNYHGISLSHSSNYNTLVNNTCNLNSEVGIYLYDSSSNNTLVNNTCNSNNYDGIYLENSDSNTFLYNTLYNNPVGFNITSGSDNCLIINTSITNSTTSDIRLDTNSHAFALNCSVNWSNINYIDPASDLTVQWYMHVNVTNTSALPVAGANIIVKDNTSAVIFSGPTDAMGWRRWVICSEYIENITGKTSILTPHNISVDHPLYEPGYAEPEPTMNVSQAVDIILTLDVTAPNPPTNFTFSAVGVSYLNISWNASDSNDVEGYNIYVNDTGSSTTFHLIDSTTNLYYNATNLVENTTYYFNITAYDSVPWESAPPLQNSSSTLDIPPSPPTLFNFTAVGSNYLNFSWSASPSGDVVGYNIYINITDSNDTFYLYNSTSETFYNATGLDDDTIYYFEVTAYDYYPWESPAIAGNSTTIDITPPSPPTLVLINLTGGTFINLSWTGSISIDVQGYDIYVNDTGSSVNFHYLNTTTGLYFNHTGLYEETTYYYKLKAFDEVPLESVFSNVASTTTLDVTPPAPPTSLLIIKIGGTYIEMSWAASVSADVAGYEVYVNDTGSTVNFHVITTTTNLNFNHTGLLEETDYYYYVKAYDEVPLLSAFSNLVMAATFDITAPSAPTGLAAQNPTGNSISLTWTANPENDIEGYHIYINDTGAGSTGPFHWIITTTGTSTGYTVANLNEETTYYFVIAAYDEVPNNSTYSGFASETTLDVTGPAMPTGFQATVVSGTEIALTWDANTETDLAGYIIYMNDTDEGQSGPYHIIHTIIGLDTSYNVIDLYEEMTYYFRIRAYDEVPNNSLFSPVASATTPDETPPLAPTGLAVSNPTKSSLRITWAENPEDDVVGYNLSRSLTDTGPFVIINADRIMGTQYSDSGLDELTTYYYKLKATDDVDLESAFSAVAFGTTLLGKHGPEINNSLDNFNLVEDTYDDTSINLYHWFKDINNDVLVFDYDGDKYLTVKIYQANGTVTLLPDENWNGQETLTFYASDDVSEVSDDVIVTVTAVNDPPGTPDIRKPKLENRIIDDGDTLDFEVKCIDPDVTYGDELSYLWTSDLDGDIGTDDTLTGIVLTIGEHIISVEVTDKDGKSSTASITVTVEETASSDTDGDTLPNEWERDNGLDPEDATDVNEDPDADGLTNLEEYEENTDPQEEDSDGDTLTDGDEINVYNTNPNRADTDRDGYDDNVDAYPTDNSRHEKEKAEEDDNTYLYVAVIVIVIIIVLILFLFVIKPKMSKKAEEGEGEEGEEEEGPPAKPEAELPPEGPPVPYQFPYPPEEPLPEQPPIEPIAPEGAEPEAEGEGEPVEDLKVLAQEGAMAYSEGRYDDAIIAWQQVLEQEPDDHPEIAAAIGDAVAKLKSGAAAVPPGTEAAAAEAEEGGAFECPTCKATLTADDTKCPECGEEFEEEEEEE